MGDLITYKMISPMLEWGELAEEEKKRLYKSQKLLKEKYVLLRVVDVDKMPVSSVCPELDYSSSAVVMLYDWVGDECPNEKDISLISFKPFVSDYWGKKKKIVSSVCLELDGSVEEKQWGEIRLLKSEEDYQIPDIYSTFKCTAEIY